MIPLQLFLLIAASCMRLEHLQQTQYYNATNYYNELNQRQEKLKSDMAKIKGEINQLNVKLTSSALTPDQQLTTLSEGMADQRDSLYTIQTYLDRPFEIEPCQPLKMSPQQKNQMQAKIDSIRKSLQDFQAEVNYCPQCTQVDWMKHQVQKQYNYLKVIQETVHSGCLKLPYQFKQERPISIANLADSLYKDNLKATNWAYGRITQSEYRMIVFERASQFNLTSCPIQTPYVDVQNKTCIPCLGVFYLDTRKCVGCAQGQSFDFTLQKCVKTPIVCPSNTILNPQTNQCVPNCAPNQVFNSVTKACQDVIPVCPPGQLYNPNTKQCQPGTDINITLKCDPGYKLNQTTEKCDPIICQPNQYLDINTNRCIDKINNTHSICPPSKPHWNPTTISCQECPHNQPVYNPTTDQCQPCPPNQQWNYRTSRCQHNCPTGLIYNETLKQCACPDGLIYNLPTKTCERCPTGQFFNQATKMCQIKCPDGLVYNKISKVCEMNCPAGQFYNANLRICQPTTCPKNSQWSNQYIRCVCVTGFIWNGQQCVARTLQCKLPTPLYNHVLNRCQACPPDLPNYSVTVNQCLPPCPTGNYWNNLTFSCTKIECPPNKPSFNYKTGQCQECQPGFVWSEAKKICQQNYQPNTCKAGQFYNPVTKICQIRYCPDGYNFNKQTNKCIKCQEGYNYNATAGNCFKCPAGTSLDVATGICKQISCPSGQYLSKKQLICKQILKCSISQYFSFETEQCISYPICGQNQYLNKNTKKCESKICKKGEYFNVTIGQCEIIHYITAPSTPNLIYSYNFSQYIADYNSKKKNDMYLRDCPSSNPYFDQINQVCVACTTANPYFNYHTNLCQNCGDAGYDKEKRVCITQTDKLDPTLERLIMNIL